MTTTFSRAGAEASNAGDHFHLLWACRKALTMLSPNNHLTAICIEGPAWEDSITVTDNGSLLSIDLSEYYDGTTYESASMVVFSQLKYSTFHADQVWTVSKLCEANNKARNNSIIRRLADTYTEYAQAHQDAQNKLVLKLASNRKISADLQRTIDAAKVHIAENNIKRMCDLRKHLNASTTQGIMLESLQNTTNLGSHDFINFLKVINFDDCGCEASGIQRIEILMQLGLLGIRNLRNAYLVLKDVIYGQMLPTTQKYSFTRVNVLASLGMTEDLMFPASSRIDDISDDYVERKSLRPLVNLIRNQTYSKICIHAGGGLGKTTFVSNLKHYLPEDSIVLVYDCFGGGSFCQPSEQRHLPKVALRQICNELAVACGTGWFLESQADDYEYLRYLKYQLEMAVQYVQKQNPHATVVLVIDAADNAVIAAKKYQSVCFVPMLLEEILPECVITVVTTRTERLSLLALSDDVKNYAIPPFNLDETSAMVKNRYPIASCEQCKEFYELTTGNPRVQTYYLSRTSSIEQALEDLRPNGITLSIIFSDVVNAIQEQYRGVFGVDTLFSSLVYLFAPIPLDVLCSLCNITSDTIFSISADTMQAITIRDNVIYLKDEDFETFLLRKYNDSPETLKHIADYMYEHRSECFYCIRHVHWFLDKINRLDDLLTISLDEAISETILPIDQANQVMLNRLKTTLRRTEMQSDAYGVLACKLLYRLIDYSSNDSAVYELLFKAPIETALYCDAYSVDKAFTISNLSFSALSNAAVAYAHNPELALRAKQHINDYDAYLQRYFSSDEEKRSMHDRPSLIDNINIAHAMILVGEDAVHWILKWEPVEYQADIVRGLFERFQNEHSNDYYSGLIDCDWDNSIKLAISQVYVSKNQKLPVDYEETLIEFLDSADCSMLENISQTDILVFLEYLLASGQSNELVASIISKISIHYQFSRLPSLYDRNGQNEFNHAIRYYVLKQMTSGEPMNVDAFYMSEPQGTKPHTNQNREDENRNDLKKAVSSMLPIIQFRLNSIQGLSVEEFDTYYDELSAGLERAAMNAFAWEHKQIVNLTVQVFVEAILCNRYLSSLQLCEKLCPVVRRQEHSQEFKLGLLEIAVRFPKASLFVMDLLAWIDEAYQQHPSAAQEMSDTYLRCSKVMRCIPGDQAQELFYKAISCTREADYESYRKLHLFDKLSKSATENMPVLSYRVVRTAEDYYCKIDDSKNFPFKETISAATRLSPKAIWGALCRLDDRHEEFMFSVVDSLSIVLKTLIDKSLLDPEIAVALLGMLTPNCVHDYWDTVKSILSICDERSPRMKPMLELIIHDALYDLPLGLKEHTCAQLKTYLDQTNIPPDLDVCELRRMVDFWNTLPKEDYSTRTEERKPLTDKELTALAKSMSVGSEQEFLDVVTKLHFSQYRTVLNLWFENLEQESYCGTLDIVMSATLKRGSISYREEMLQAIKSIIDRIALLPEVIRWRNDVNLQKKFLYAFFDTSLYLYHTADEHKAFCSIFHFNNKALRSWIIEYILTNDNMYDEKLVVALMRISDTLPNVERIELLDWALSEEMQKIHPSTGDSALLQPTSYDESVEKHISTYIWRCLGHPDKNIRWKAAHVLLRLNHLENDNILFSIQQHLFSNQFPSDYMDSQNYFFIESAQLWYLFACLRVAKQKPDSLRSVYSFFRNIACNTRIVNALHRNVAKDICLLLLPHEASDEKNEILKHNQYTCGKKSNTTRNTREDSMEKLNTRFHFDTMDTLPYWYDVLASIFTKTQRGIAQICDPYIEEFRITNQSATEWRKRFLSSSHYGRTQNRHGSIPTLETLGKYAEWHAMFYAADELRMSTPAVEDYYTYGEWLDSFYPGCHGFWFSELIGNIPCQPFFWQFKRINHPEDRNAYFIPERLPDSLVTHDDCITLSLDYSATFEQSHQRIRLDSAIVIREDLDHFLDELKKPNSTLHHFYRSEFEYEDDKIVVDQTICVTSGRSDYGLDNSDLLAKDMTSFSSQTFDLAPILKQQFPEPLQNVASHTDGSREDAHLYRWIEGSHDYLHNEISTYGHMISVKQDRLQAALASSGCLLVFVVDIKFEDRAYQFHGTHWETAKMKKIYVLQHNGLVNSIPL